ncbi:MAG: RNase adapter RapZ [Lachnospiraceae bacterium]|nr:RNase adapter RapZ [Lachnospiraceae bacterium]
MRLVIVTGMSGAGKTTALKMLEDSGYFCVDNLPISFLERFAQMIFEQPGGIKNAALGIDVRNGDALDDMAEALEGIVQKNYPYEILFLDASEDTLVKRYKETRRSHPLAPRERVDKGITLEREKLKFLKKHANYIIDTSQLLTRELKQELEHIFVQNEKFQSLIVTVLSFGFKYGIPVDSDLVFDVRFLPNPFYVEELKNKTGNDAEVQEFVMGFEIAAKFLDQLEEMLKFLIPNYILEGKNQLVISIGCTGGKHRSVTLANAIYKRLKEAETGCGIKLEHRDIKRK